MPLQMFLLGLLFMALAFSIFNLLGFFAGAVGKRLLAQPRIANKLGYATAAVFAGLGLRLALADH